MSHRVNQNLRLFHYGSQEGVVGDWINDAVALTCADMGVAIGSGTEVAVEAASVVWVHSLLHDVAIVLDFYGTWHPIFLLYLL